MPCSSKSNSNEEAAKVANQSSPDSRREALKKIGRFTTYVAPVMFGIISQKTAAFS